MANETSNEFTGAVNNLMESAGKIGQMQVDLVTNGFKSVVSVFEPLGKTAAELSGNLFNTINQVLQNVSSAIAPKK
jgi:chlorosome envelope protein B